MQLTLSELSELLTIKFLDHKKENAYGICPECGHDEFGISLKNNHRFGCFRKKKCGFNGNIFTLLRFLGKKIVDIKPSFVPRAALQNKLFIQSEVEINLDLPDVTMPIGWKRVSSDDYLNGRGFSASDYDKFQAGVSVDPRFKNMIVFAIKRGGRIKGYVARNRLSKAEIRELEDQGKKVKRYKNSESDFGKMLLGIEECTENTHTIILVEGLFDKHNVDKVLKLDEDEEIKCCCTFKCAVSDEQIYQLQEAGIETIILLYDPDVIKEIKRAGFELEHYFKVMIGFEEGGKDPGDMNGDDFDTVLNNLKSPNQFNVSKLHVVELRKK